MIRSRVPRQAVVDRANRLAIRRGRPLAPAIYTGRQQMDTPKGRVPAFDMWNLTEDIPGHPVGSTVSSGTLLRAGYRLPEVAEVTA